MSFLEVPLSSMGKAERALLNRYLVLREGFEELVGGPLLEHSKEVVAYTNITFKDNNGDDSEVRLSRNYVHESDSCWLPEWQEGNVRININDNNEYYELNIWKGKVMRKGQGIQGNPEEVRSLSPVDISTLENILNQIKRPDIELRRGEYSC